MTGAAGSARYHATVLDEPTPSPAAIRDDATTPSDQPADAAFDVAAVESEFAQIDEALARLDRGDLDGAEAIADALAGTDDMVIDLTTGSEPAGDPVSSTEPEPTDEGTEQVVTTQVSTPTGD